MTDDRKADNHAQVARRDAWRRLRAALMAVSDRLDVPYEDDPRWTPWTRFVKPAVEDVDADIRFLTGQRDQAVMAVNIFYKLAVKVQEAAEYNILGSHYAVGPEAMDDLSDFLADFHDDNPALWALLLEDVRRD